MDAALRRNPAPRKGIAFSGASEANGCGGNVFDVLGLYMMYIIFGSFDAYPIGFI